MILVISGASGSGKSTLAKRLLGTTDDSILLAFDDFNSTNVWYEEWLEPGGDRLAAARQWRASGHDPNRLVRTPGLVDAIHGSKDRALVIVEEPFGRLRDEVRDITDVSVHVSTPLDIALARKVVRDAEHGRSVDFLQMYLATGLRVLNITSEKAAEMADLVIDGTQTADRCEAEARTYLGVR